MRLKKLLFMLTLPCATVQGMGTSQLAFPGRKVVIK